MSSNSKANSQQPIDALAGKLKRTELQHSASSIPGREVVQVRTEIPVGASQAGTCIRVRRSPATKLVHSHYHLTQEAI